MLPTASDMEGSEDMLPTASYMEGSEDMLPTASDMEEVWRCCLQLSDL